MREIKITFKEVKEFILKNSNNAIESIIDATEPFVMDYMNSPFGFAETDNENEIEPLLDSLYWSFVSTPDGRVRRGEINSVIKREREKWNNGRNAGSVGRLIGRIAHLLNQSR